MERVVGDLQRRALALRTAQLRRVLENLPRVAHDIARGLGKQVDVELHGVELELDRSILDRLADPLAHLVRNAVDHGLEAPDARAAAGKSERGTLRIEARPEKDKIRISVQDDGKGIDLDRVRDRAVESGLLVPDLAVDLPPEEIAALVFHPGLSTAEQVSEVSGRGVGMDAVRATIEGLGGHVEIATRPGAGTTTSLVVPVTAAVQRVLLAALGRETVALPIGKVERLLEVQAGEIENAGGESFILIDDEPLLVLGVARCLNWKRPAALASDRVVSLIIAEVRGERVALQVDRVTGQQQIYVKPVPALFDELRALAGMTALGDGRPVFLLDLNQLV